MDRTQILACLTAAALLAGCSTSRQIVVGSKNFTEQVILGEIIAQHLERRLGTKVDRKLNLGGTLLSHQALVNSQIDLYPEYTGTALTAILKLEPLGFNNTFAMTIHGEEARRRGIETLSDAARRQPGWTIGMGYEFQQRPDGLRGLVDTYKLPLNGTPKSMDLGLLYKAMEQRQVDMISANATDGLLSVMDLKVLRDDKNYFPPYQAAVLVRRAALEAHPGLREALGELAGKFTDQTMQKLNYEVDGKHRRAAEVAAWFWR
jgi:glycine betaine/choline ABC-type transport system substrate-binding protein